MNMNALLPSPEAMGLNVAEAPLPALYEAARTALDACESLDECKDWADKALAMRSYARQSKDRAMFDAATRIQARAIRRTGELLATYDARPDNSAKQSKGAPTLLSQQEAARGAGLSRHQQVTAVRVANVPADTFEAAVEGANPATVTALAEMGRQARPPVERPPGFAAATELIGTIREFSAFCAKHDPAALAAAVMPHEAAALAVGIANVEAWLREFSAAQGSAS